MQGHIRQRSKGSWSIVIELGRDAAGKRRQKWHTVHGTKKDAQRELTRLMNELNTGVYIEPSKLTVGSYLEQWLQDSAKVSVSAKTYERYAEIVHIHLMPALGMHLLSKLQPLQIQSYYSEALQKGRRDGKGGLSAQTVLHHHRVLRKALQDAVRWQMIARNPAESVEAPRVARKEMRVLSGEDIDRLLQSAQGTKFQMPTLLAISTGMRRGEILALRWDDIDMDSGILTVRRSLQQTRSGLSFKEPKTAKARTIALPRMAVDALRRHRATQAQAQLLLGDLYTDNRLVCTQEDGSPVNPESISRNFGELLEKADLPRVRFHDLRHSHATMLLREGIHPKVVSERLGHSTIGITLDVYSHVLPTMQEEAARKIDDALRAAANENHRNS